MNLATQNISSNTQPTGQVANPSRGRNRPYRARRGANRNANFARPSHHAEHNNFANASSHPTPEPHQNDAHHVQSHVEANSVHGQTTPPSDAAPHASSSYRPRHRQRPWNRQPLQEASGQNDNCHADNRPIRSHRGRGNMRFRGGSAPRPIIVADPESVDKDEISDQPIAEQATQSEIAESELKKCNFECMICCDTIHRSSSIWYCDSCYNIFHLKCAIEWCNKSIKSRQEAAANAQYPSLGQPAAPAVPAVEVPSSSSLQSATSNPGILHVSDLQTDIVEWPCPACRLTLHRRPGKYKCFCGKVIRPEVKRHLTPHSCGQLCGRKRPNSDCPHPCNNICHPGRCAPCALSCVRLCFCQKVSKDVKCSSEPFGCEQDCGKPLKCGQHFCKETCHLGQCGPCNEIITIVCHCGSESVEKMCVDWFASGQTSNEFSCGKTCEKALDCGKHVCSLKCHPGPDCPSCSLLNDNIKTCPCGSTQIKKSALANRSSCTDPVPTCEGKCNKELICGPQKNHHKCQKKCHVGHCPPCKLKTTVPCDCRLSSKTVDCNLMFERHVIGNSVLFKQVDFSYSCEARCNKLKNCGRHRCYNKCCKFTKTMDYSLHKCDQICNKRLACGNKNHTCPEVCHQGQCGDCTNIGWNELTCHCGASVMYPPIACGSRPPTCRRPCQRAHSCSHPVKHECHDDSEKCTPCTVFVKKSCFCGSESKDSVHCYLAGYSCGKTCKKPLQCGRHTCKRVCHDGECQTPDSKARMICDQPCPEVRYLCKHPCALPCHGSSRCPSSECKKIIEIKCECGNRADRIECHKNMKEKQNVNIMAMMSSNRSADQNSIVVDLSKTTSNNNGPDSNKKLDCDDTCALIKRNKALAEALEISQPDLKPTILMAEDPLRLLREATAQDYKFVSATYSSLSRFVKSAKESEKRFIFLQYPPCNKLRREVIHELAYHFKCTSESQDEEPFRHVVVRAYKNKSSIPEFNIEQLLPVEDESQ